jgi:hypothetical protein
MPWDFSSFLPNQNEQLLAMLVLGVFALFAVGAIPPDQTQDCSGKQFSGPPWFSELAADAKPLMQVVLSLGLFATSLYMILSHRFTADEVHWAYGLLLLVDPSQRTPPRSAKGGIKEREGCP